MALDSESLRRQLDKLRAQLLRRRFGLDVIWHPVELVELLLLLLLLRPVGVVGPVRHFLGVLVAIGHFFGDKGGVVLLFLGPLNLYWVIVGSWLDSLCDHGLPGVQLKISDLAILPGLTD
jgi:hypothetical protein